MFKLVEARKAMLLEHMDDIGQTRLGDAPHGVQRSRMLDSTIKNNLVRTIMTSPSSADLSTRGVWMFQRNSFSSSQITGLVTMNVYGFTKAGDWAIAQISFAHVPEEESNKTVRIDTPDLHGLIDKYLILPEVILSDLKRFADNHLARRTRLYESARDLVSVMEVEDQILRECGIVFFG
ncbi:MAG TPA: hypothetical protein VMR99_00175 [Candidatus Paceibacterota bacterium]|nr:hypothetical protein [Candidatus Paceibacterota bacterium]